MSTTVKLPSGSDFSLELDLAHAIVPAQCKTKIMTTKVKMKVTISWCKQSWLSNVGTCWSKPDGEIPKNYLKIRTVLAPALTHAVT